MAHQRKNAMNIWQKLNLQKALTSFCNSSEACPSYVLAQITRYAPAFDIQLR